MYKLERYQCMAEQIYVYAGYCPWHNTYDHQPVSCSFLPRITHPNFVTNNIFCTPHPDQCPTYNAWLKDDLPQTRELIAKTPDHLLSNFTLNHSIPVDFRTQDTWPANWTIELIETTTKWR